VTNDLDFERSLRGDCTNTFSEELKHYADGKVRYDLKRVWADGTEAIILDPLSFLARLAALVPPPPIPSSCICQG
jgi:hypothetical protein